MDSYELLKKVAELEEGFSSEEDLGKLAKQIIRADALWSQYYTRLATEKAAWEEAKDRATPYEVDCALMNAMETIGERGWEGDPERYVEYWELARLGLGG